MTQLTLKQLSLAFGEKKLLDQVDLVVEQGQKIGVMGRNGVGKSTLLKLIAGIISPDAGEYSLHRACKLAYLPQEVPVEQDEKSVFDVVSSGLGQVGQTLKHYHALNLQLAADPENSSILNQVIELQQEIDSQQGWLLEQKIESQLSRFHLEGDIPFNTLSGGLKRRVLLAKAMLSEPNLLLLDEPTNHLDIASIEFLERFLSTFTGTIMVISHDRSFLQRTTNRIIELDLGKLHTYAAGFSRYLDLKEARLNEASRDQALFDKKLAQEEAWIRQGVKARRTRNQGRVRALEAMRAEKRAQRKPVGTAKLTNNQGEQSGKQVILAQDISFSYPSQKIPTIEHFSTLISRGDRVAIIGPNGVGKSTLLKLLLGKLPPTLGKIKIGTHCQIAYFDQLRETIDLDRTLRDNVGGGSDQVTINGKEKHIVGYLQDFLFTPEKIHAPARVLSGGERNRLLLAKLFTQPANLLVMDEPTNDLDIETLELLEELLSDFPGTLILVSHDREFIDKIATHSLVFEKPSQVNGYIGGYTDWLRQKPKDITWENEYTSNKTVKQTSNQEQENPSPKPDNQQEGKPQAKKRSYKEQRELEKLPAEIETAEASIESLQAQLAAPKLYQTASPEDISALSQQLEQQQKHLNDLYKRWESLE